VEKLRGDDDDGDDPEESARSLSRRIARRERTRLANIIPGIILLAGETKKIRCRAHTHTEVNINKNAN
jgi:hypothetical protein